MDVVSVFKSRIKVLNILQFILLLTRPSFSVNRQLYTDLTMLGTTVPTSVVEFHSVCTQFNFNF